MKYEVETTIDLPRERVIELFDNPDNLPKWQPTLQSFELISGESGQPGAKSRLVYLEDGREIEMIETIVNYKPEYRTDAAGRRINFRYDRTSGEFVRDPDGELIPDRTGRPYRQWRDHIRTPDDIWREIVKAALWDDPERRPSIRACQYCRARGTERCPESCALVTQFTEPELKDVNLPDMANDTLLS